MKCLVLLLKTCLLGDFNSRTSTDPDFVSLHEYDDNDEFSEMIANESVRPDFLHELGFQIERYNSDKRIKQF